jgi:hypothetical protein
VPTSKLQQGSGGTVANGGKGAKTQENFEIFGLSSKSLFLVSLNSKSLFQSHYCHLSQ